MKKILVPVDFSSNSVNALYVAADIAHKTGSTLELLHVNVSAVYSVPFSEFVATSRYENDDQQYDENAVTELEKIKLELITNPAYQNLKIEIRVKEGYLHSAIQHVAQDDHIDLVVMGTKGSSGMGEFLVGSNTEKVIRTAPCPVLAVPENAEVKHFAPKVVLLPSTLRDDQVVVFRYLAALEKKYPFLVKVLYLNNARNLATDGSAEAQKNRFAEASGLKKTDVILTEETFFEDNAILAAAEQNNADLIVMGTHQRQGLSHLLFGSITEDTVNHSNVPVLAVPLNWKGR